MQIKLDNISYVYNQKTPLEYKALDNVSLEINEGEFTALVGKTGSGKSTLGQLLNGLLLPTNGRVLLGNFVLSNNKKERTKHYSKVRELVGLVFQFSEYQLFEETVEKDIGFGPKNYGCNKDEIEERVKEAMSLVGLDESFLKRSPFDLSGGEKRRVALAGILACKPKVLIVDEPTSGLDPQGSKAILQLLNELNKKGITIVMITHDMEAVIRFADRVIVLDKGNIIFEGTPLSLFSKDVSEYSLDCPISLKVARSLNKKGMKIDVSKVKNLQTLVDEIKRNKK